MMSFIKCFSFLFLLISSFGYFDEAGADNSTAVHANGCGDWKPYHLRCYKVFDRASDNYADAKAICSANDATLIQIHLAEEQEFAAEFIFKDNKIVDNVWLGARYDLDDGQFKWNNGKALFYENWQQGYPKTRTPDSCLILNPDKLYRGKWLDTSCQRKSIVVCQKHRQLSGGLLDDIILEVKQSVSELSSEFDAKPNVVPIGFVYVQLPYEPSPKEIWPQAVWTDVSDIYRGLFFRVAGEEAAEFGTIQAENAPRVANITVHRSGSVLTTGTINLIRGEQTGQIVTGYASSSYYSWSLNVSGGEVRPRNTAIKIWKRSA